MDVSIRRDLARWGTSVAVLLCSVALVSGGDEDNSDVVMVTRDTVLNPVDFGRHGSTQVKALLDLLPEHHSLRVEFVSRAPDGGRPPIRYIETITSQDAKGRPDGVEQEFANWYQGPCRVTPYRNGLRHGPERIYDGSGEPLLLEVPWVDGAIHGTKKSYYPSGELASETQYTNGLVTGVSKSYATDGQLLRVAPFVDGKRHGEVVDYWEDRDKSVKRLVTYHKGAVDGPSRAYYLNGQLKWERMFKDNRPEGVERHYAADGTVERTRHWLDGEQVTEAVFRDAQER